MEEGYDSDDLSLSDLSISDVDDELETPAAVEPSSWAEVSATYTCLLCFFFLFFFPFFFPFVFVGPFERSSLFLPLAP